jgi:DNA-directed RNA polymerase beta' subunit
MVQLDGAVSPPPTSMILSPVINRNNRLKRLLDRCAEIIFNNEKRISKMRRCSIRQCRRGRAVTGPFNRPLNPCQTSEGKQDASGRTCWQASGLLRRRLRGWPD